MACYWYAGVAGVAGVFCSIEKIKEIEKEEVFLASGKNPCNPSRPVNGGFKFHQVSLLFFAGVR